jgi:hypothetical protein
MSLSTTFFYRQFVLREWSEENLFVSLCLQVLSSSYVRSPNEVPWGLRDICRRYGDTCKCVEPS